MRNIILIIIGILISAISTSCTNDEFELSLQDDNEGKVWHKGVLTFNPITEDVASRADGGKILEPKEGDMLLLQFDLKGYRSVCGYARYNGVTKIWELSYMGELAICSNLDCEVLYIGNSPVLNENLILERNDRVVYSDSGVYSFKGNGNVDLRATLSPQFNRIKFKGNKEMSFEANLASFGDLYYSSDYNYWSFYSNILSSDVMIKQDDGYYSPYYYCDGYYYGNNDFGLWDNPYLKIKDGETVYLWKRNLMECFKGGGKSGIILLPDIAPNDWYNGTYRDKNVSDITVAANEDGVWSQTQEQTRIYSSVGIEFGFYYTTTTTYKLDSLIEYPFVISVRGYDINGSLVDYTNYQFDYGTIGYEMDFVSGVFFEGAVYYEIQFYGCQIDIKITNFKISTFFLIGDGYIMI